MDFNPDIQKVSENLSIPNRGLWWFSGYILTNKGAKKLLNLLPVVGPIDLWINHKFSELNVFISNPSIINQKLFFSSDNNYSILPILSQIGVKSNKTFIDLDKLKGINPVFIFDLNSDDRTNLIKLEKLLSLNSYRTYLVNSDRDAIHLTDLIVNEEPLLFDAYIGFNAIIEMIPSLVKFYPNVKVILLTEDNPVPKEYSQYLNQKIFCVNSKKSITREVSKLLKIKNWNLNNLEIPKIDFNLNKKEMITSISNNYEYLEHDVHPWVIPIENIAKYLPYNINQKEITPIAKSVENRLDNFEKFDSDFWVVLEDTFPFKSSSIFQRKFQVAK